MFKFSELEKSNFIAIDTETYDPNLKSLGPGGFRKDGKLVGISIATDSGYNEYFPIGHEGGGNLNNNQVIDFIDKWIKTNPVYFADDYEEYYFCKSVKEKYDIIPAGSVFKIEHRNDRNK